MTPLDIHFHAEKIHESVFVAPGAVILGNVTIGEEASVWYGTVIRGDTASIHIGNGTNIQDGCILHADPGYPCAIGNHVTLGHGAIVHGATIEHDVLIGMRAVVMNGAKIGTGSIVGVGAVVPEGMEIPPGSVVLGIPAVIKRQVTEKDIARIAHAAKHYVAAGKLYLEQLRKS
jgi:carbonic anhydrase/acetyltransferase-like protein (isoleucine patch superfamily)